MAINPEDLTVNFSFRGMLSVPKETRQTLLSNGVLDEFLNQLSPTEQALLFPDYYKQSLPDVVFGGAGTSGFVSERLGLQGAEQPTYESGIQRRPLAGRGPDRSGGVDGGVAPRKAPAKREPTLQERQVNLLRERGLLAEPAFNIDRKSELPTDRKGLMRAALQAAMDAGLSPNQAAGFIAQINRENSFKAETIFGYHAEPGTLHTGRTNAGMLSWAGPRRAAFEKHMRAAGLMDEQGNMPRTYEALLQQFKFAVEKELPTYKRGREFLANPEVNKEDSAYLLGKYVGWDMSGRRHPDRRSFQNALNRLNTGYDEAIQLINESQQVSSAEKVEINPERLAELQKIVPHIQNFDAVKINNMTPEEFSNTIAVLEKEEEKGVVTAIKVDRVVNDISNLPKTGGEYQSPIFSGTMLHEGHGRTAEFGYGRGRLHAGVDLYVTDPETGKLKVGDEAKVFSPADGKITLIRKNRGRAGNYIEIRDNNGIRHRFLHTASETLVNPSTGKPYKVGDKVDKGQHLTYVTGSGTQFGAKASELGSVNAALDYYNKHGWGSVNKPHLHYETRDSRGKPMDPMSIHHLMQKKYKGQQVGAIADVEIQNALKVVQDAEKMKLAEEETKKLVDSIPQGAAAIPERHPLAIRKRVKAEPEPKPQAQSEPEQVKAEPKPQAQSEPEQVQAQSEPEQVQAQPKPEPEVVQAQQASSNNSVKPLAQGDASLDLKEPHMITPLDGTGQKYIAGEAGEESIAVTPEGKSTGLRNAGDYVPKPEDKQTSEPMQQTSQQQSQNMPQKNDNVMGTGRSYDPTSIQPMEWGSILNVNSSPSTRLAFSSTRFGDMGYNRMSKNNPNIYSSLTRT